ncbi:hypothetical protein [Paenibacillus contaminans]|uniref:Uncharacterized protein n=1 Tax=Paenibacillus contaminans TaxID=450362 RepID=A0A329MS66_9BACL|nr:hypothetical protein [Paenibacillus contaminans]RAV22196.1 hypothetical protein DQG23_04390 [Paenibacillus contaminans]
MMDISTKQVVIRTEDMRGSVYAEAIAEVKVTGKYRTRTSSIYAAANEKTYIVEDKFILPPELHNKAVELFKEVQAWLDSKEKAPSD